MVVSPQSKFALVFLLFAPTKHFRMLARAARLPGGPGRLAPMTAGALRGKKKDSKTKRLQAKKATLQRSDVSEDAGQFIGELTAINANKQMEVTLEDGRVVRAKTSGKLSYLHIALRVGQSVCVQYDLEMDEDGQTPSIIGRLDLAPPADPGHRS